MGFSEKMGIKRERRALFTPACVYTLKKVESVNVHRAESELYQSRILSIVLRILRTIHVLHTLLFPNYPLEGTDGFGPYTTRKFHSSGSNI